MPPSITNPVLSVQLTMQSKVYVIGSHVVLSGIITVGS